MPPPLPSPTRLSPFVSSSSALRCAPNVVATQTAAVTMRSNPRVLLSVRHRPVGHDSPSKHAVSRSLSSTCKQQELSAINNTKQNHFNPRSNNHSLRTDHASSLTMSRCNSVYNRITPFRSPHVRSQATYSTQSRNASHSGLLHASCLSSISSLLRRQERWAALGSVRSCMAATNVNAAGKILKDTTPAPKSASAVVVGGGSLGCSVLYHLAKLGVTDTVLVEANKLTAGTTWHTAGLIWRLRPNDTEMALLSSTHELLNRLEEETGVDPGWINNGGLYIASSKERLDEYKRLMTLGRAVGVESHVLTPQETKKLYPLMNVQDVHGSLYCPGSGTVNPAGLCDALIREPKRRGATILENCAITGFKTSKTLLGGRQITQVKTPRGNINTNVVINATGVWANQVTSMLGLSVPLLAMKHAYVVTEKIPGIENMPNVRDHDASVYLRLQGDALSIGGYEKNPLFVKKMSLEFAFGLYDLDYDVFDSLMQGHINRVPALANTGIKSTVCGPESFTPDHKPVMGEDPEVEGFFHCCGFNSAGMMLGGGCGEQLARWIVSGRPDLDMFAYDIRRFHTPLLKDKAWVKQRSHEAYAKNYSIVFPHDEPLAGRGMRRSPLHNVLERAGCVYQERHGWERPGWFNTEPAPVQKYDWYESYHQAANEDQRYVQALHQDYSFDFSKNHDMIKQECLTCRNAVVGFDMSYFGKFYLTGPDATEAADHLFSANTRRPEGSTVYTCMLNERGGTEADLTVSVLLGSRGFSADPRFYGTGYYLAVGGAAALQNYAHILKEIRKNKWNVKLTNQTDDLVLLSVQGPKSRDLLSNLTSADLSNEAFPFSTHQVIEVAEHKVRALRVSFVGELGWELHIPRKSSLSVYKAVVESGKQFGYKNSGYRAMDSLSCEKGYRHWHSDVRPDDTPLEAGLGFTCKLKTDIPFLGRQALERQKAEGLKRKLVTLTLDDTSKALWGQEGIKRDGKFVGFVRRAEFGFALGTNIAYGYVERPDRGVITKDFLTTGSWSVDCMGEEIPAKLHTTHPFDPKNERIKGNY